MRYAYSRWDGSQEIGPLDPDELLDLLTDDLLEDGDLRNALDRLMMRGAMRPDGDRLQGLRDMLERLRQKRQEQLSQHNLSSFMDDIADKLRDIVEQERQGIEQRQQQSREGDAPQDMKDMLDRLAERKRQSLDQLPEDASGMMQKLMDYEFMDEDARESFNELMNELRQQMMQNYFQGMQQSMQGMTPEDLAPIRDMVRELNQLLSKQMDGNATQQDFQDFMDKFGSMFPEGIEDLDDLIEHLQRQASQMQSLLNSMPEEMRRQLEETMDALLRDDRLRWDLAQMAGMIEQLTGQPLGQSYQFGGEQSMGFDEALRMMGNLHDLDELERQLQRAMRQLDADQVSRDLTEQALGPEAAGMLDELQRLRQILEDAGYAEQGKNDLELTAKAIRRLGERALHDIFAELRKDRSGQHDARNLGISSEQETETKPWEFGDPFLVDIGKSVSNAVVRGGAGIPVSIEVKDLEIYKTESLVTAATIIVLDMSYSMIRSGAFREAKKVALALNTLIKTRYPRDYLELVVFSYFATELAPERLLKSDWATYGRGTNIQEGLRKARELLKKARSTNRQIILITDAQPTTYTGASWNIDDGGWGPYGGWMSQRPQAIQETLKEVRRCTRNGIRINTFMMAHDPSLVEFAKLMTQINKGRAFFASASGQLGKYVLVDYMKGKTKII